MLERCCLPRLVRIAGKGYRLSPPSVRQAVEILHVLDNIEDEADQELLVELVSGLTWSPSIALNIGVLRWEISNNRFLFKLTLYQAITQGYEPSKIEAEYASDQERIKKQAASKSVDYGVMVERYREVFGGSSWEVWNRVPFTFFLEKMKTYTQERARKNINTAVAHSPSKDTIKAWQSDLNGGKPKKNVHELKAGELTPEEIERSKQLSKQKYMGR